MRIAQLLSLAGILFASSCSALDFVEIPENKDWNLRELHADDGSHNLRAATMGDTAYFLRFGLGGLFRDSQQTFQSVSKSRQENVPDQVLENFTALAKFSSDDPHIATMQAKWAIWLVVADPWPLVRERAALELGRLSKDLDLGTLEGPPAPNEASGAKETEVALTQLIRAAKSSLYELRAPNETEELDIQAACAVVRDLKLTVETGRDALEVLELLMAKGDFGPEFREPIEQLARELAGKLAGQALVRAVRDPEPIVRAAAIQAIVEATGTDVLRALLEQMAGEPSPVVLTRVMRLIRQNGLPELPDSISPEVAERVRQVWVDVLYSFATAHQSGIVRVNAMQTMHAVVGGPDSLRSEDWQRWWHARQTAADAATSAAGTTGT